MLYKLSKFQLYILQSDSALKMLHSLSTNSINEISEDALIYSALADSKARLIADFYCFLRGDDVAVIVHETKAQELCNYLNKYKVFYNFNITHDAKAIIRYRTSAKDHLAGSSEIVLADPRSKHIGSFIVSYEDLPSDRGQIDYEDYLVENIIIPDSFLLVGKSIIKYNLPALNCISYHKGCYPGQEVVMGKRTYSSNYEQSMKLVDSSKAKGIKVLAKDSSGNKSIINTYN